jgi:hypothetical protein
MKIAQRFSAGSGVNLLNQRAREAGDRISALDRESSDLCRPFHGLTIFSRSDPSAEALGYFHTSAIADDVTTFTFWASRPNDV